MHAGGRGLRGGVSGGVPGGLESTNAHGGCRHLGLGKLIVFYDDNHITIDGGTDLSFSEDVEQRFKAYGFHTQFVANGDQDLDGIARAIEAAQGVKDKPSLIRLRTTIGIGSAVQGTAKAHGAPLGKDALAAVKSHFGFDPAECFVVPTEASQYYSAIAENAKGSRKHWDHSLAEYTQTYAGLAAELERRMARRLPEGLAASLPKYSPSDAAAATRKLSETVLCALSEVLPEMVGGSADLTPSNLTKWKGSVDFQRPGPLGSYAGRYIRYGVREHGMFAIANGLCAYGGLLPFTSTFLNFISYGIGAVRLTALTRFQQIFIMTHDSIGLGEDGPTHQPIETLAALRAMSNILTMRPADGNEVSGAYLVALESRTRPSVLALSRQNLPQLQGSSAEAVRLGAYVLQDCHGSPDVVLVGTGSELALCVEAAKRVALRCRIVSMPCTELFDEQPLEYRCGVFPSDVPVLSVEAGSTYGWQKYAHASLGIDTFGASGPYAEVYAKFGLTAEGVAEKAVRLVQFFQGQPVPCLTNRPF